MVTFIYLEISPITDVWSLTARMQLTKPRAIIVKIRACLVIKYSRVVACRAGFIQWEALGYLINEALVSNDQTHLYGVA